MKQSKCIARIDSLSVLVNTGSEVKLQCYETVLKKVVKGLFIWHEEKKSKDFKSQHRCSKYKKEKKKKGCFEGADHCENTLAEIPWGIIIFLPSLSWTKVSFAFVRWRETKGFNVFISHVFSWLHVCYGPNVVKLLTRCLELLLLEFYIHWAIMQRGLTQFGCCVKCS